MKEDRKIEVTKLNEQCGCVFNDRISIEFTPSEMERMTYIFEQRALDAKAYGDQTMERETYELFEEAFRIWENERSNKEEEEKRRMK